MEHILNISKMLETNELLSTKFIYYELLIIYEQVEGIGMGQMFREQREFTKRVKVQTQVNG